MNEPQPARCIHSFAEKALNNKILSSAKLDLNSVENNAL